MDHFISSTIHFSVSSIQQSLLEQQAIKYNQENLTNSAKLLRTRRKKKTFHLIITIIIIIIIILYYCELWVIK
ncbi:putative GTP-binding protein [Dirofilaria immitis]